MREEIENVVDETLKALADLHQCLGVAGQQNYISA
jgi:hypothetical protein